MKTKSPEASKLAQSEVVERDHELALMVEQAFGDDWKKLSPEKQRRVLEATPESNPNLYAKIKKAAEKNSGAVTVDYTPATPAAESVVEDIEPSLEDDAAPQKGGGMIRGLARKAAGLGNWTKTGAKNVYWATTKPFTAANYAYSKFVANRLDASQKWSDTYNNMSAQERREHHKKVAWRGNLAVLGGAALMLVLKNKGVIFGGDELPQPTGGVNPDQAPAMSGAGVQPDEAPTPAQPNLMSDERTVRDPQGSTDLHEYKNRVRTLDDYPTIEAYGRNQELNWLNANQRQGNDFNNITPEELNDPANKDHFPGYMALKEQFEKSPNELAAQLRQIQVIEAGKGLKLDFIPEEFRGLLMQPGESQEGYIARLGNALHDNNDLHKLLSEGALKYIEANAQPLRSLDQNYAANFIVLVDGVPTVGFDQFVQSASEDDTVLMLSDTMGIRFPCGQCIELIPHKPAGAPVEQPSYSAAPAPEQTQRLTTTPRSTTPGGSTPGGNTPGGGGGNPPGGGGGDNPPGGGGENPPEDEEHKIWDGHPPAADGLEPVTHIEDTEDFATRGNGTASPSGTGGAPQSEAGTRADGTAANTDQQVGQQEAGAGENRTDNDAEARREAQKAEREQKAANDRAEKAERDAQDAKKQDDAVKAAQSRMGADGRPDRSAASGSSSSASSGGSGGGESGGSSSSGGSE